MRAAEFLTETGWVGYTVPTIALLLGLWALRRPGDYSLFIEIVIAITWLLSLVWFGSCLLLWEAQNVPIFSGMRFHF